MDDVQPHRRFRFRRAGEEDSRRLWAWRNEPAARAASFNADEIPFEQHREWFMRHLRDSTTRFYIASDETGREVGYLRFDLMGTDAQISVALDSGQRGRGAGRTIIRDGVATFLGEGSAQRVIALVKKDNAASLSAFKAAGFVAVSQMRQGDIDGWILHFPGTKPDPSESPTATGHP